MFGFVSNFCPPVRNLLGNWQAKLQMWLYLNVDVNEDIARTISFVILVAASVVIAVVVTVLIAKVVSHVFGAIAFVACCRCLRKSAKTAKAPAVVAK